MNTNMESGNETESFCVIAKDQMLCTIFLGDKYLQTNFGIYSDY